MVATLVSEPGARAKALLTFLDQTSRYTRFRDALVAAAANRDSPFSRVVSRQEDGAVVAVTSNNALDAAPGVIVCVFWDTYKQQEDDANTLPTLLTSHVAVNGADRSEAEHSTSLGETGITWSGFGLRRVTVASARKLDAPVAHVQLYDAAKTDVVVAQARCVRTDALMHGQLVVHVLTEPLRPTVEAPMKDAALLSHAFLEREVQWEDTEGRALSAVDACCPRLGTAAGDRNPCIDTHRTLVTNGCGDWANAVRVHAAATPPLRALGPQTLRLLTLECAARNRGAATLFVPVDEPVVAESDGDGDDECARRRAALLQTSCGRYVLRPGRTLRADAVRSHFASGVDAAQPLVLGPSMHLGLPLSITDVDADTGELVLNGTARVLSDDPLLTAAGLVYRIDRMLSLE
jgi:hypothetical protein